VLGRSRKVTNNLDCDDALFAVHPGVAEVCNGRDDNCNAMTDEGLTFSSYYRTSTATATGRARDGAVGVRSSGREGDEQHRLQRQQLAVHLGPPRCAT